MQKNKKVHLLFQSSWENGGKISQKSSAAEELWEL